MVQTTAFISYSLRKCSVFKQDTAPKHKTCNTVTKQYDTSGKPNQIKPTKPNQPNKEFYRGKNKQTNKKVST